MLKQHTHVSTNSIVEALFIPNIMSICGMSFISTNFKIINVNKRKTVDLIFTFYFTDEQDMVIHVILDSLPMNE